MAETPTAAEVARAVADLLEHRGYRYAIGGALALGFYAAPRATIDVDVNVFIALPSELDSLLAALGDAGFAPEGSPDVLRRAALEEGQFRGRIRGIRVDVFVPANPFYARLEEHRREVTLLQRPIWILGPEDLAVLKLMFFRRKDLADVEGLLREQRGSLDRAYVRRALVELVGEGDERVAALEEIERDVDASG